MAVAKKNKTAITFESWKSSDRNQFFVMCRLFVSDTDSHSGPVSVAAAGWQEVNTKSQIHSLADFQWLIRATARGGAHRGGCSHTVGEPLGGALPGGPG